jgi:hypothetical protein
VKHFTTQAAVILCAIAIILNAGIASSQQDKVAKPPAKVSVEPVVDTLATAASTTTSVPPRLLTPEAMDKLRLPRKPNPGQSDTGTTSARDIRSNETIVLATYDGGTFTNQDLSSTLALRKPRSVTNMDTDQIMSLPIVKLRDVVRDFVYELVIYERAKKEGVDESIPEIKKKLDEYRATALNRLLLLREIEPRLKRLDEKAVRDYYEENKNTLYTRPAITLVKEIFISAYKPYIVKAGDTLTEIASREAGDEKAASRMLRDDAFHFPRLPAPDMRDRVPFEDVHPGENLLVPLAKDEATSKSKLAAEIRKRLVAGADFDAEARKYSETPDAATTATAFEPELDGMVPELKSAIQNTEANAVTDVVRSPHGWHIFKIADRQTTHVMSFEEVRNLIKPEEDKQRQNMETARTEIVDKLRDKFSLKINTDALSRDDYQGTDPLTADTSIVTAPGFMYTLEEFRRDMLPTMKSWTGMTSQERLNLAKTAPGVLKYLIEREAKDAALDKTPEFAADTHSKELRRATPPSAPPTCIRRRSWRSRANT